MTTKNLFLVLILFVYSCSKKEVQINTLVERNGLFYEINSNKPFSGLVYELYENGQKKNTVEFKDGLYESEWKGFSENGQLLSLSNYKKGKLNGLSISYFDNGNVKSEIEYSGDFKDGYAKSYYLNGQILEEANYKQGKKNGINKKWNENGVLFREGEFKNGIENGTFKNYYYNGNIEIEKIFSNGKLNGPYKEFFENGKPRIFINYKNGLKNGKMEEWYDNANKFREITYSNDKPLSKKTWNIDGTDRPIIEENIIGNWFCDLSKNGNEFLCYYTLNSDGSYIEKYFNGGYSGGKPAYWTTEGYWYIEDDKKLILNYNERCGFGYCDRKQELIIIKFDGKKLNYEFYMENANTNGDKREWIIKTQNVN